MNEHLDADLIAGLPLLAEGDPERVLAEEHLRGCAECRRAVNESERLLALIDAQPPPILPSEDALASTLAKLRAHMLRQQGADLATAATTFAVGLGLLVWCMDSGSPIRLMTSFATLALAAILAGWSGRSPTESVRALAIAVGIASVVTVIDLSTLDPHLGQAFRCERLMFAAAFLPFLSSLRFHARCLEHTAASAASGALVGQAALLLTCGSEEGWIHVVAFHLLALMIAAGVGALLGGLVIGPRASYKVVA